MKLITVCVIAAFAATTTAMAEAQETGNQGYLVDSSGRVVMSGSGLCWHTTSWTSAQAMEPCDPTNKRVADFVYVPPAPAPAPAPTPAVAAYVPPAPAPAPAPVAVVAPPLPQKISFSGDALFTFDKSELRPRGMEMLDGLVRQLEGAQFDTIIVTGHTDRIGSSEYNQKLSERRAATVKEYLMGKDIRASRIDAQGKGKTEPVTTASECAGAKSAKVIACLQPDRRVDIEMTGTRAVVSSR